MCIKGLNYYVKADITAYEVPIIIIILQMLIIIQW